MHSIHQHGCHVSCDPALQGSSCSEDGLHGLLTATENKLEQGDCTEFREVIQDPGKPL